MKAPTTTQRLVVSSMVAEQAAGPTIDEDHAADQEALPPAGLA